MTADLLTVDSLAYTYPGGAVPSLDDVSFAVESGECVCLTGNSGCGKTTLLLAIKGLLHGERYREAIRIDAAPVAGGVPAAIVFQNAESQILCTTVAEEVAFGPENICVPPPEIARRIREALSMVGLGECAERNVERFSAGQKQRLAIASVLAMSPSLLLLDEPTSQLDAPGKRELCAILGALKRQGCTIVLAEHDPRPFAEIIDRYLTMSGGRIAATSANLPAYLADAFHSGERRERRVAPQGAAAIAVNGLSLSYPQTGPALRDVRLRVAKGERVLLYGNNGAGKSSLLRCLVGLESPDSGTVELAGLADPTPDKMPGKVGFLFQNPARHLFAESVHDEVAFTLLRLGYDRQESDDRLAEALELCAISHLAGRGPLTLSFGEQHRVALAAVVAPRPSLLLLDEPFAGLDIAQRLSRLAILAEMPGRYGTTVLIASHDELPDQGWADRTLVLDGGVLGEATR